CDIEKFTVIRKRDGPIGRLDDEKLYPKTPLGYLLHLRRHHESTLISNGVYLKCACGLEIRCGDNKGRNHIGMCEKRRFSLHKLDEIVNEVDIYTAFRYYLVVKIYLS
ncbi:hypothetical protein PENTCL1PPCAC_24715, partial [Pristionchus entomophagus]